MHYCFASVEETIKGITYEWEQDEAPLYKNSFVKRGTEATSIECLKILVNGVDAKRVSLLLQCKNSRGQTPMHLAMADLLNAFCFRKDVDHFCLRRLRVRLRVPPGGFLV